MIDHYPFIDKRLEIKWTELGYAVFSNDSIKSGTFVEMAPVIVCDPSINDKNILKYVMSWNNNLAIPLGWTGLYNHSDNNSCEFLTNIHHNLLAVVTLRDIKPNEQLTVNYGPEWFSSRNMEKLLL